MAEIDRHVRKFDSEKDHGVEGMTEAREKAFNLAAEAARQILTLSVDIIALIVTFLENIFQVQSHKLPASQEENYESAFVPQGRDWRSRRQRVSTHRRLACDFHSGAG
jgi:hypothetical protein